MRLCLFLWWVALILLASPTTPVSAATAKPKYLCDTDADCEERFPDTVCIPVDMGGDVIGKCTPNTKERPACRGAQPGLCPSYQSPEAGYLNAQCVFVVKDVVDGATSATNRIQRRRQLAANATSNDGSAGDDVVVLPKTPGGATVAPEDFVTVKIGTQPVTGEFMCVDVSDCANKAADETTCEPLACGSPGAKEQCNNHGTCSHASTQTMSKRSCRCYAGFGGDKCQHEISNACDVDCGLGGDCVDGQCQCKKGYDGGKNAKGKPNQRCTKCTSDKACQNGNTCNLKTGACECGLGYSGPTCGATEDACTKVVCGNQGKCQLLGDETAVCVCHGPCAGECPQCTTYDCSSCAPSAATTLGAQGAGRTAVAVAIAVVAATVY